MTIIPTRDRGATLTFGETRYGQLKPREFDIITSSTRELIPSFVTIRCSHRRSAIPAVPSLGTSSVAASSFTAEAIEVNAVHVASIVAVGRGAAQWSASVLKPKQLSRLPSLRLLRLRL